MKLIIDQSKRLICFILLLLLSNFSQLKAQGSPDDLLASSITMGETHATIKVHSNGYFADTTELKLTNMLSDGTGTEFVLRSINESGLVISSNSDLAGNTTDNIMTLESDGDIVIGTFANNAGVVQANSTGRLTSGSAPSAFAKIDNLNTATISIPAGGTWQPIGPILTFNKVYDHTVLTGELASRVSYTSGSANGVFFRVQIAGQSANMYTEGAVVGANNIDFVVAKSIYTSLPTGSYSVQVHARTVVGTASGVLLDTGGFQGSILVEERL